MFTNFTFGKVLGTRDGSTSNGNGNGPVVNPFNLDANYGPLEYDHTKVFNLSLSYKLPKPIHNNWALGEIDQRLAALQLHDLSGRSALPDHIAEHEHELSSSTSASDTHAGGRRGRKSTPDHPAAPGRCTEATDSTAHTPVLVGNQTYEYRYQSPG